MPINPIRGEATVKIGDGEYVLAATMEGLAQLSGALQCRTLQDLYERLVGTELLTTLAALRSFVQSGTNAEGAALNKKAAAVAATSTFTLSDAVAVQAAFVTMLTALTRTDGAAEPEKTSAGQT